MSSSNKRKFTRFVVLALAILSAELLVQYLTNLLVSDITRRNPYINTLIRMGLILLVLYPSFLFLKDLMRDFAKWYVKKTKDVAGSWWQGIMLGTAGALTVLVWGYAKIWYGRYLFQDVSRWIKGFL